MKIFISQPMNGRTEAEIREEREYIKAWVEENYVACEFIESYFVDRVRRSSVEALGGSIKLLSEADVAIFAARWEQARGCRIEHEICKEYGIECGYAPEMPNVAHDMTMEREGRILEAAVTTFGAEAQAVVAMEEMAELTRALSKWIRNKQFGQVDYDLILENVLEEMADVGIMLNQLGLIFGDVTDQEIRKLKRLEEIVKADG